MFSKIKHLVHVFKYYVRCLKIDFRRLNFPNIWFIKTRHLAKFWTSENTSGRRGREGDKVCKVLSIVCGFSLSVYTALILLVSVDLVKHKTSVYPSCPFWLSKTIGLTDLLTDVSTNCMYVCMYVRMYHEVCIHFRNILSSLCVCQIS
jgi:hypothetical protein